MQVFLFIIIIQRKELINYLTRNKEILHHLDILKENQISKFETIFINQK